jgi:lipopolysaccharide assembly protein A
MGWRFVLSLIFAVLVALFAIQNAALVEVTFFVWHISISQALVILISAVFGAIIVMLLSLIKRIKLNSIIKGDKKTISILENENKSIKSKLEEATAKADAISGLEQSEEQ